MTKKLLIAALCLIALFSFASCSDNEPRKATAEEARVLRAMDGLAYENLRAENNTGDVLIPNTRALQYKFNLGNIALDTDLNAGDGKINYKLDFSLTGFDISVTDDEGEFTLKFDGTVSEEFKAGFIDNNFDAMNSLTVSAKVQCNEKAYDVKIVENFSAGASHEKLYFIGNTQVTL